MTDETNQMWENSTANVWVAKENQLRLYKWIFIFLTAVIAILLTGYFVSELRDPLVISAQKNGFREYQRAVRQNVKIENTDIEEFSLKFLSLTYVWDNFNAQTLSQQLNAVVEPSLIEKIIAAQTARYIQDLKGKKLSQDLAFIKVEILPDRVICRFDRILKIENMPVVIPTVLTLSLIKGDSTVGNPIGIYVAGIIEHENAH